MTLDEIPDAAFEKMTVRPRKDDTYLYLDAVGPVPGEGQVRIQLVSYRRDRIRQNKDFLATQN